MTTIVKDLLRRQEKSAYRQLASARYIYKQSKSLGSPEVIEWALRQEEQAHEQWVAAYKAAYPQGKKETRWTRP